MLSQNDLRRDARVDEHTKSLAEGGLLNWPFIRKWLWLAACGVLVAGIESAADGIGQELPLAPHAHVLSVSPQGGHFSEPGIAINPRNPKQIVVVFQGGKRVQGTATAAYSIDGGQTFALGTGTDSPDWKVLGDVTTTFDNSGSAYLCSIAFDKLGTSSYWAHGVGRNGIIVRRSRDGGKTWDAAASNVKTFPRGTERDIQFEDEPRIYADNNAASPHAGALYVGWVEWQLTQSVMFFSRSTDHGETWSQPLRISTRAGLPRDDNGGLGGYTQATGPDGSIYAAWADGVSIVFTTSSDGGLTFAPSHSVISTGPVYFGEVTGVARVSGFPTLAMEVGKGDVRKGHAARLYLCWSDYTNGDVDVFVSSSQDGGRSWSAPMRVNNDPIHNGSDQFFQWMAVDPVTGNVFVDFYDRRTDPANNRSGMTIVRSTDEGRTFKNYRLSSESFNPAYAFLGDYTWMDAFDNRVAVAWTETAPNAVRPNPETVVKVGTADF
jgi:hypothetical protein